MIYFNSPVDARSALMDYLYDREESVPDDVREELRSLIKEVSPVRFAVESIKLLVDRWPDIPDHLREWGLSTAIMAAGFGFSGVDAEVVEIMKEGR